MMKHVHLNGFGDTSVMVLKESSIPKLKPNESLVEILGTSLNRADTLQRAGKYPSPPGMSEILGLECAGYVVDEEGKRVKRVMTLLSGGGYAQYVAVPSDHLIEIPEDFPIEKVIFFLTFCLFLQACGISEVYLTSYLQIKLANLQKGDFCLIYAAASGVGIATIQICNLLGIIPIASCSAGKVHQVKQFTTNVIDRGEGENAQLQIIRDIIK